MNAIRGLLAAVKGDPIAMRKLHIVLTFAWLLFSIPVVLTPFLRESVPLLVFISIYANVVGHWSAAQAAQVEVKQDVEQNKP